MQNIRTVYDQSGQAYKVARVGEEWLVNLGDSDRDDWQSVQQDCYWLLPPPAAMEPTIQPGLPPALPGRPASERQPIPAPPGSIRDYTEVISDADLELLSGIQAPDDPIFRVAYEGDQAIGTVLHLGEEHYCDPGAPVEDERRPDALHSQWKLLRALAKPPQEAQNIRCVFYEQSKEDIDAFAPIPYIRQAFADWQPENPYLTPAQVFVLLYWGGARVFSVLRDLPLLPLSDRQTEREVRLVAGLAQLAIYGPTNVPDAIPMTPMYHNTQTRRDQRFVAAISQRLTNNPGDVVAVVTGATHSLVPYCGAGFAPYIVSANVTHLSDGDVASYQHIFYAAP